MRAVVILVLALAGCTSSKPTADLGGQGIVERVDPETGRVTLEKMPVLIGGIQGLQERLVYPTAAKAEGRQGKVRLQVIVDEEGNPEQITVLESAGSDLDTAAIMAMIGSRFEPGTQNGIPVKVKMNVPVTFRLNSQRSRRRSRG